MLLPNRIGASIRGVVGYDGMVPKLAGSRGGVGIMGRWQKRQSTMRLMAAKDVVVDLER